MEEGRTGLPKRQDVEPAETSDGVQTQGKIQVSPWAKEDGLLEGEEKPGKKIQKVREGGSGHPNSRGSRVFPLEGLGSVHCLWHGVVFGDP